MHQTYINKMIKYLSQDKNVDLEEIIDYYLNIKKQQYLKLDKYNLCKSLISELNYELRNSYKSSELLGFKIKVGDLCYIDFGNAYVNEAGYQHFGIIINYYNSKALVIPMSSNYSMYQQSYCPKTFPNGKKHLFRLPKISGLNKRSVLFLNDLKFINTARIIEVKGHLCPKSELFKEIVSRVKLLT